MLDGIVSPVVAYTTDFPAAQDDRAATVTPNSEHEGKLTNTRQVRTVPGQDEVGADARKRDSFELSRQAENIQRLQRRDREVRAHEAAHAAAGGAYAGGPSFSYEHGSDGRTYAVDGEVSIDVAPVSGDPQATLQKAQQVRSAALAPAEPSAQDMRVAQRAQSMAATARMEISQKISTELTGDGGQATQPTTSGDSAASGSVADSTVQSRSPSSNSHTSAGLSRLSVYA